jgi:uncharacterized protein (TIGR02145 family)
MSNVYDCNTEWGQIVYACGDYDTQSSSSSTLLSSSSSSSSSNKESSSSSLSSSSVYVGTGGKGNNISNYKTVQIGTQIWMAENLNYDVAGSKCYNNLESNCDKYGRLYDWATMMALDDDCRYNSCASKVQAKHRGICPSGWHIPSSDEWKTLMDYVESSNGCTFCAAKYLKAKTGWNSNGNGEDTYGFAALPGGTGYGDYGHGISFSDGDFSYGNAGFWWGSTEDYSNYDAYSTFMLYSDFNYPGGTSKSNLHSVRCVKDDSAPLSSSSASQNSSSSSVTTAATLAAPVISSIGWNANGEGLTIEWDAVPGATSYAIYKSNSKYGSYTYIATTSFIGYDDMNLDLGNWNFYQIAAIASDQSEGPRTENPRGVDLPPSMPSRVDVNFCTSYSQPIAGSNIRTSRHDYNVTIGGQYFSGSLSSLSFVGYCSAYSTVPPGTYSFTLYRTYTSASTLKTSVTEHTCTASNERMTINHRYTINVSSCNVSKTALPLTML